MKKIITISLSCLVLSCNGVVTNDNQNIQDRCGIVEECLKSKLEFYYNNIDVISNILTRDYSLQKTNESYSTLYYQFYLDTFTVVHQMGDDDNERKVITEMHSTLAVNLQITNCAKFYDTDSSLTKNQKQFYQIFAESAMSGFLDLMKLSDIVGFMSEEEFSTNGIQEASLFYFSNYLIRNYYMAVSE